MSYPPEVESLRDLLERVLNVEATWMAVWRGGDHVPANRRRGEQQLEQLVVYASEHGHADAAQSLASMQSIYDRDLAMGVDLMRELRISVRLELDGTCLRLGVPRIPPATAFTADGAPLLGQLSYKPKVGRNDPCPCGSGKKFKRCCWEGAN